MSLGTGLRALGLTALLSMGSENLKATPFFSELIPEQASTSKSYFGRFSFLDKIPNEGDELGIFYKDLCIGYANYIGNGQYRAIAFGDDWRTPEIEWGAPYGAEIEFRAFNINDKKLWNTEVVYGIPVFRGMDFADRLDIRAVSPIPETSTIALLGLGAAALFFGNRNNE